MEAEVLGSLAVLVEFFHTLADVEEADVFGVDLLVVGECLFGVSVGFGDLAEGVDDAFFEVIHDGKLFVCGLQLHDGHVALAFVHEADREVVERFETEFRALLGELELADGFVPLFVAEEDGSEFEFEVQVVGVAFDAGDEVVVDKLFFLEFEIVGLLGVSGLLGGLNLLVESGGFGSDEAAFEFGVSGVDLLGFAECLGCLCEAFCLGVGACEGAVEVDVFGLAGNLGLAVGDGCVEV